jgi:hypothetical protein
MIILFTKCHYNIHVHVSIIYLPEFSGDAANTNFIVFGLNQMVVVSFSGNLIFKQIKHV